MFPFNEPFRPAPQHNNVWYTNEERDQALVFVHGVLSDSAGCWYCLPQSTGRPGTYWPDLIQHDTRFSDFEIFLGGYYTAIDSRKYQISDCAEELFGALARPGEDGRRAVLDHSRIVFVCHSMGGVVVRYMLGSRPWKFRDKTIGLVLIASPSAGSQWANRLDLLIRYFKHEQGVELQFGDSLADLDRRFKLLVGDKGIPDLSGAEAYENRFVYRAKWLPELEAVVTEESAGRYFGRPRLLPNTDHFTCVKPSDREHPAHLFLVDFCAQFATGSAASPESPQEQASPDFPARKRMRTGCRLHWDLSIDEEGDAYNEMSYSEIVLKKNAAPEFPLARATVQSGHMSPYELIWGDGRTSEGTALKLAKVDAREMDISAAFAFQPTAENPASFCVRNYDWNVYSMNMEEFRQKPGWRDDGLDYAEKAITRQFGLFSMLVRFPTPLTFAKRPFFEVLEHKDGLEIRNDALTRELQHCFTYSPYFNEAVLTVPSPPAPYSYRVSWLLGESRIEATSSLTPILRLRQRTFSTRLLAMRAALENPNAAPAATELNRNVTIVLASFAEFVQNCVSQKAGTDTQLDPASIDLSLMVLDESLPATDTPLERTAPVLRIVTGTRMSDPHYRDLALNVGDGNAGRAWKRRIARIFDVAKRDPKSHVYVPSSPSVEHAFLISIPLFDPEAASLMYGVLNFGTFSTQDAECLRLLDDAAMIETLTSHAQSYVLKRLQELLKM